MQPHWNHPAVENDLASEAANASPPRFSGQTMLAATDGDEVKSAAGAKIITFPRTHELAALRATLAERFPTEQRQTGGFFETGWPLLDAEGGLRRAAVTEVCGNIADGALLLQVLLALAVRASCFAGLVEATSSWVPDDLPPALLERWLWVRAREPGAAVKAVDLLLRDGNLPLLVLDLQMTPERSLRGIPATTWHRFQRLAEQSTAALVVCTRQPLVEAAQVRITLGGSWTLAAQSRRRAELIAELPGQVFHRRRAGSFSENWRREISA